jgi:hypothetical protein
MNVPEVQCCHSCCVFLFEHLLLKVSQQPVQLKNKHTAEQMSLLILKKKNYDIVSGCKEKQALHNPEGY